MTKSNENKYSLFHELLSSDKQFCINVDGDLLFILKRYERKKKKYLIITVSKEITWNIVDIVDTTKETTESIRNILIPYGFYIKQ